MVKLPFDERGKKRVAEAVAAAEAGTSGEIVVVVERRAGRYGDALAVLALLGASIFYLLGTGALSLLRNGPPEWTTAADRNLSPIWGLLVWVAGFIGVWFAFEGISSLLRIFVSEGRRKEEAEAAAWRAFGERGVHRTQGRTGVLLFVAEFEKTVVVLGDRAIDAELSPSDWEGVRDRVLEGYRKGRPDEGLLEAIGELGRLLGTHFPVGPDDRDEISDEPQLSD